MKNFDIEQSVRRLTRDAGLTIKAIKAFTIEKEGAKVNPMLNAEDLVYKAPQIGALCQWGLKSRHDKRLQYTQEGDEQQDTEALPPSCPVHCWLPWPQPGAPGGPAQAGQHGQGLPEPAGRPGLGQTLHPEQETSQHPDLV